LRRKSRPSPKLCSEDKPIQVTGADSRMPVVMALAAGKSSEERRPVRISEVSA
jgi:hypothetical protein